jgi:hypothetical protein
MPTAAATSSVKSPAVSIAIQPAKQSFQMTTTTNRRKIDVKDVFNQVN